MFREGKQTRSFCYVDDLVRGIVALLSADSDKTIEQRKDKKYLKPDLLMDRAFMIRSILAILGN